MLSITIGDLRVGQYLRTQTLQLSQLHLNQCQRMLMTMSLTISAQPQLQNKSDCLISHPLARTPVHSSPTSHKSKQRQRKRSVSKLNCKSHKSSTNNAKLLRRKSEKNRNASEKKKRPNKRKFDNFKCFVNNKKHKRLQRKLLLLQLSANNKCNKIQAFSSHKDQKCLLSTTLQQP